MDENLPLEQLTAFRIPSFRVAERVKAYKRAIRNGVYGTGDGFLDPANRVYGPENDYRGQVREMPAE